MTSSSGCVTRYPYLEIAKTYTQQGEFFIAARNAEKALSFDPSNANTYGQLGIIYIKSRNYEGALPTLRCAVKGCSADENEVALRFRGRGHAGREPQRSRDCPLPT